MGGHFLPAGDVRKQLAGLSKKDPADRIAAAKSLITTLRNTDDNKVKTVEYCLTRLAKGLTSQDDASRAGFSLALSELLYNLLDEANPLSTELHFRSIVQLIVDQTEPAAGLTKQEERAFYFGRLFGLQALLETGLLFRSGDTSRWQSVLSQLILLSQKKPWLREACCLVIKNAVLSIDTSLVEHIKATCDELDRSGLLKTSDGVGIWLALLQKHKPALDKLDIQFQNRSSPLEKAYLPNLAKILKESEGKDEHGNQNTAQKSSWNARLPWVWDSIFDHYADTAAISARAAAPFGDFWQTVVNDGLFSNNASEERKFWGFLVFNKALSTFDAPETVSTLFSPNFVKCFINQLAAPERYLHKAAQKSLRAIKAKAETTPALVSTLLSNLLTGNGTPNFEAITKTKVIEPLVSHADSRSALDIVNLFKGLIIKPDADDPKAVERSRQWAVDQLLSMLRNSKIELHKSWVSEIVDFLVLYGHFNVPSASAQPELAFSPATQATFRTRLSSCLSELLQRSEFRDIAWPAKAVLLIQKKRADASEEFAISVDENIDEQIAKVSKIVSKLDKKSPAAGSRQYAFEVMYSLLLLQLFNGESDAMDMLEDLHLVYESIGKSSKKDKKKDKHRQKRQKHDHNEDHADDSEEGGLEILVELLLGFLAKPSVLAKKMSQTVFKSFADELTAVNLESLLHPLMVNENEEGQRELFDIVDEDEEMDDVNSDEDNNDEEDSDVEIVDVEDADDDDDDEEEEDSEESDEDSEEDSDTPLDEETRKLHAALEEALGTSNVANDGSDSDSDSSMDDDQMLLVDEQLSKIFKQRKAPNKKQQKASAKESVINFKNRILELLEIYVKSGAKHDDKIVVIPPCLEVIRRTGNPAVRNNAQTVLKALTQSGKKKADAKDKDEDKKETELELTEPESAFEILERIHEESRRQTHHREHASSCSQCSLHIAKLLISNDKSWLERVTQLYFSETMLSWMTDAKCGTQASLFTDFVTWAGTVRKTLTKQPAPPPPTGETVQVNGKKDKKRKRKQK